MTISRKLAVILSITLLSQTANSQSNIDILIVFSDDTNLSAFEKTVLAEQYQLHLGQVYGLSAPGLQLPGQLDGTHTIEVWPLITPEMSYTAGNKDNADALQWMIEENAKPSTLSAAREILGNPGADIVLMVVPGTTDNDCGAAPAIPKLAGTFNSEDNAFAIVYLEDLNPTCPGEIVVPHEVGHLLYAEHETDENGDNVSPDPENHATTSTSTGQKTLMWDGIHPFGTEFLSGNFATTTVQGWADNVEFMSRRSFEIVAGYRAPRPGTAMCNYPYFLGCHQPGCAAWMLTFSANNATSYRIESRNLGVGSWIEEAVTSGPNHVAHRSGLPVQWRIQGVNSAGVGGEWCFFWTTGECEVDDDPPNPYN